MLGGSRITFRTTSTLKDLLSGLDLCFIGKTDPAHLITAELRIYRVTLPLLFTTPITRTKYDTHQYFFDILTPPTHPPPTTFICVNDQTRPPTTPNKRASTQSIIMMAVLLFPFPLQNHSIKFVRRCHPPTRKPASQAVLSRIQLTRRATRPTPRRASCLAQAMSCLVGKNPTWSVPAL